MIAITARSLWARKRRLVATLLRSASAWPSWPGPCC